MPRGYSITPRGDKRASHLREELKASFIFNSGRDAQHDNPIPVVDNFGKLSTRQTGIKSFSMYNLTPFYALRSQSWTALTLFSVILYLLILTVVACMYYCWGIMCGAKDSTSVFSALYFSVVSLAANGGYLGEDPDLMQNSTTMCFKGRTVLVMLCSYVNIFFVGFVAALMVGKAEFTGYFGKRIVFSEYCTINAVPGCPDRWTLAFRLANILSSKPLVDGKLLCFCVMAEPLTSFRQRRSARHAVKYQRKREREAQRRGVVLEPSAPTMDLLRSAAKQQGNNDRSKNSISSGSSADAPLRKLIGFKKSNEVARGRHRGRRERLRAAGVDSPTKRCAAPSPIKPQTSSTQLSPATLAAGLAPPGPAKAAKGATALLPRSDGSQPVVDAATSPRAARATAETSRRARSTSSSSTSTDISSDRTNTSCSSASEHASLLEQHKTTSVPAGSGGVATASRGYGTMQDASSNKKTVTSRTTEVDVGSGADLQALERVHIHLHELAWSCAEERYTQHGGTQLSLWFPSTITHTVDERSPLYKFLDIPSLSSDRFVGGGGPNSSRSGNYASRAQRQLQNPRRLQLVTTFTATDMETGANILASHTYTMKDIVAHHKFSNRLVRMHPNNQEIMLDYHHFNDVVPTASVEPSTTDSDVAL